jgi:hypothetical protein
MSASGSDTDLGASQREVRFAPINTHRKRDEAAYSGLACFAGCPTLVGHPGAEIAVFGLGLAFLHKRDAGSAVRHAVAIENGQVHEPVVENVSHDRRERLSAVDMHKAPVAGKA